MSAFIGSRRHRKGHAEECAIGGRGFTLIEILIGLTVMTVGLLGVAGMFSTAYTDVSAGGKTTMALTATRQIIEDMRLLPFDNIADLNNFNTDNPGSVPPVDATKDPGRTMARTMARKWRYALQGEGAGWSFTTAEKQEWSMLTTGGSVPFGGSATVTVASPSATLRQITITVPVPGRVGVSVSISTLVSRL
jgi:prepilin-type N-terminal cleavage/methylation domain-containing protein